MSVWGWAQDPDQSRADSAKTDTSRHGIEGVYKVLRGITPPKPIYQPEPEYSKEARKKKLQGTCILQLVVDSHGNPRDIRVEHSLGMGLDEEAIKTLKKWKFDPAVKDGQPVATQIDVELTFHLY